MRIPLYLLLLVAVIASGCSSAKPFSKGDVRRAQHLIGLEFTNTEIDTMYGYLQRNLAGYDSMRRYELDYNLAPAVYFDPRPDHFSIDMVQRPIRWALPEAVPLPANREELAFYSVEQLSVLIRQRKIRSEELTRIYLDRIRRHDPALRAVITLTEELALEQARRADEELDRGIYRGPLHGIPYGVKDLAAVPGYPTTWGSAPYRDQSFDQSATIVARLEDAGAVLLAKLSSGALARGDVWFDAQTKNPWDLSQGASGSSAGSASAVAAGLVGFAIGTETLGSIVSPSNRCGATGLRPTYGAVSRYGVMALSWTMDKVGPICRTAMDCALVFAAIRGADGKDRTVVDAPFNYDPGMRPAQLRVGYLKAFFDRDTTAAGDNNRAALAVWRDMGIQMDSVNLPEDMPYQVFDVILRAESGAFFDKLLLDNEDDAMVEQGPGSRANSLRQSRFIPAVEYLQANRHRKRLIEAMHALMQQYDVILTPTFAGRQLLITNLTGHPALSLPTGWDGKGRPTSMTLLGNLFDEATLVALGRKFQERTNFAGQQPPLFRAEE